MTKHLHKALLLIGFLTSLWPLWALGEARLPSRLWRFDVIAAGTYKLQVEHPVSDPVVGQKVTYTVTVGAETRSRELDLVANRPFAPLIVELASGQPVQIAIRGLTAKELDRTRVYFFDANSLPAGRHFDPEAAEFLEARIVRTLLTGSTNGVDLARAKLTIDKAIDPGIDIEKELAKIDAFAARVRQMPEFKSSGVSKLLALKRFVYEPGPWNGHRPYQYDLDDPFGHNITNKLLPTYMGSRKGNCVTMPLFLVILGQRLGIDLTAATAPKHILVKFRQDNGQWINLEATSGANPARDAWLREQMPMTDEALANGVYLRPLAQLEVVALMATVVIEHLMQQHQYEKAIELSELTLAHYRNDVGAITMRAVAYGRLARHHFAQRYSSPQEIPAAERGYFDYLVRNNRLWFAKAESLGWREESKEDRERYLQRINSSRQARH